ncbi:MAG: O-acetyl-ADP-ribose deacetylase (regulator of RNase III) [Saprospiraceae bacterium]|jgi:O-acetyl-ADP-ribose deacetylase (regulator of RNase III)
MTESTTQGKNYLLAIAIDNYKHIRKLNNSVRDTDAVVQLLTTRYLFDAPNIVRLYNAESNEREIYRELKRLALTLTEEDNLVIYFAGHGIYDEVTKEGFWIPVDAEQGEESDYIGNDKIIRYIKAIKARHIFLMADACFSGSLLTETRSDLQDRLESQASRWVLTSGRNEVVSDGKPGSHSPFAKSLLTILARKKIKPVLVSDVVQYVKKQTAKLTKSKQVPLGGALFIPEDKGGEFIFHPRKKAKEKNITRTDFMIHDAQLCILYSDIRKIEAEVIVSSDDEMITMTGGVSEAIRGLTGEVVFEEAQEQVPAKLGEVIVTSGGKSSAKYIFHAITIDYKTGERVNSDTIEKLTKICLKKAEELQVKTLVFPALATGVARADFEEVASAMVDTIGNYLLKTNKLDKITITLKGRRGVNTKSQLYSFYQKSVARAAIINQVAETYKNLRDLQNKLAEGNDLLMLLPIIQDMQSQLSAVEKLIENKSDQPARKQSRELKVLMSSLTDKAFTMQQTMPLRSGKADLYSRTGRSVVQTINNINRITMNKIQL